jgi:hypothetical protein
MHRRRLPTTFDVLPIHAPSSDHQSTFLQPPIVDGKCEMYWGETAQSIFEQLSDVVGAMNCDECGGFGYHKMSCSSVK